MAHGDVIMSIIVGFVNPNFYSNLSFWEVEVGSWQFTARTPKINHRRIYSPWTIRTSPFWSPVPRRGREARAGCVAGRALRVAYSTSPCLAGRPRRRRRVRLRQHILLHAAAAEDARGRHQARLAGDEAAAPERGGPAGVWRPPQQDDGQPVQDGHWGVHGDLLWSRWRRLRAFQARRLDAQVSWRRLLTKWLQMWEWKKGKFVGEWETILVPLDRFQLLSSENSDCT